MRKYYELFCDEKLSQLATILSWSHYIELLSIKDINAIKYYIDISIRDNLSRNKLREIIKKKEYQRLSDKTKEKLINNQKLEVIDFIKDPIILNNNNDYNKISELVLKEIILNDLSNFLKQLGNGFCYIDNEYKIKVGDTFNYIDILLFNIIFNCYVVVELKVNKLRKQDIGQIQVYMNYINDNLKMISHNKTIGIIVCKENDKYLIKYSSDKRIKAVTYEII